jgi:calcineurin-like phosphoesterase family protein
MSSGIWFIADSHFSHGNIIKYCDRPFIPKEGIALRDKARSPGATWEDVDAWRAYRIPAAYVYEHDEVLIHNWNKVVAPNDEVYHLGDVFRVRNGNVEEYRSILKRLNGRKYLILGNHDMSEPNLVKPEIQELDFEHNDWDHGEEQGFSWIKPYYELTVPDISLKHGYRLVVLSHYCHTVWNVSHYGSFHLWGHNHAGLPEPRDRRCMDVGVDATAKRMSKHLPQPALEHYRPISYEEVEKELMRRDFKIEHGESKGITTKSVLPADNGSEYN